VVAPSFVGDVVKNVARAEGVAHAGTPAGGWPVKCS
jgi:hypothetical protein